ncbi:hypothetical protein KKH23_09090 [Patescibacteria group bacterium]|nr:hypothetical protein [Patescibacteria group bacterium]
MKLPKIQKVNKTVMVCGISASVAIILPWSLRSWVDSVNEPLIPAIGVWGKYGTFLPITFGGIAVLAALFMKRAKPAVKQGLGIFGTISVLGGVLNGITDSMTLSYGTRARMPVSQGVTRSRFGNGFTPTLTTSNRQDDWVKAKGFGSDPSKAPDAQIPTKITKQIIYS